MEDFPRRVKRKLKNPYLNRISSYLLVFFIMLPFLFRWVKGKTNWNGVGSSN